MGQKKRASLKKLLPVIFFLIIVIHYLVNNWGDIKSEFFPTVADPSNQAGNFQVHFIDVGQGDCILINSEGHYILIDAGEIDQGNKVVNYLHKQGVYKLDLVIATHPHSDHIGGMAEIIEQIEIEKYMMPRLPEELIPTNWIYDDFLQALSDNGIKVTASKPDMTLAFGNGVLTVLGPIPNSYTTLNSSSLVCRFDYGEKSFLFTGDAEAEAEDAMLKRDRDALKADVLKVGHHGSSTSTTRKFYNAVDPEYCVIMVGLSNDYGHPHRETRQLLKEKGVPVYRTDLQGSIVFTLQDDEFEITYEKQG